VDENAESLRNRYEALAPSDPDWLETASRYASTSDGRGRLEADVEEAMEIGEAAAAAQMRTALLRGEALRAARDEAARRERAGGGGRSLAADESARVAAELGVSTEQVLRDHAITRSATSWARSAGWGAPMTSSSSVGRRCRGPSCRRCG
jgi:hypothetical protein